MQGAGIVPLMWEFVSELWPVPAFLLGGYFVLSIVKAIRRGSGV